MFFFFHTPNKNFSMPEQGGTGIVLMPEQGGTGLWRIPKQIGTGLTRALFALAFACALPVATVHAASEVWQLNGEVRGNAQINIDRNDLMQMSFMLANAKNETHLYVASGAVKGNYARLAVFRADMMGKSALVRVGSLELFLNQCGADAELQLKAETDGTGGKAETDGTGGKAETDGTGGKAETDGTGGKAETDGTGNKAETDGTGNKAETDGTGNKQLFFNLSHTSFECTNKAETDGTGGKAETDGTG